MERRSAQDGARADIRLALTYDEHVTARRRRPLRVRLVFLALASTLIGLLFAGCAGGGTTPAKVEDTIQNSLNHLDPTLRAFFPVGAGPPRVKANSCKKIAQPTPPPGRLILPGHPSRESVPPPRPPKHLAWWSCVVRLAHTPFPLRVALEDNGKIYWAELLPRQVLRPGTATVYQGGPKQPQP